jgi:hypothetical protein
MDALSALDLLPLLLKLPADEQVRLAALALEAAHRQRSDAEAYRQTPPTADEFGDVDDNLGWDADGWDEFHAAR